MILSVTLNPSVDHALFVDQLRVGDTNRVKRTERDAGGKGINLSRVVAELGARTIATGFVGGGPGDYVRGVLNRQGVAHDFVEVAEDTRINFSVEDSSLGPPTTFNEPGPHIRPEELESLFAHVRKHIGEVRWMTLGGSLPPGVPADVFAQFIRLANEHGVRAALDTDGEPLKLGIEAGPVFLKPNAKECGRLLSRSIETPEQALAGAIELNARLPRTCVVIVSLGQEGAVMACDEGNFRGYSPQVEVRSTIGSGDSLIGGFLWALEEGNSVTEALRWGLACGAATATTNGSEIARKPKVLELLPQAQVERLT